ncbi:MAG: hypothetical protein PHI85_05030 [Victivallaceae bacterium]|nr:hypothetical protein [Victivallaceae bacterium]
MVYEEFNRISGQTADRAMYDNEIEPIYLFFGLSKQEVAALYWGKKPGYYDMWLRLKNCWRVIGSKNLMSDSYEIVNAARHIEELENAVKALKIDCMVARERSI